MPQPKERKNKCDNCIFSVRLTGGICLFHNFAICENPKNTKTKKKARENCIYWKKYQKLVVKFLFTLLRCGANGKLQFKNFQRAVACSPEQLIKVCTQVRLSLWTTHQTDCWVCATLRPISNSQQPKRSCNMLLRIRNLAKQILCQHLYLLLLPLSLIYTGIKPSDTKHGRRRSNPRQG